jgi:hypothetical protein
VVWGVVVWVGGWLAFGKNPKTTFA